MARAQAGAATVVAGPAAPYVPCPFDKVPPKPPAPPTPSPLPVLDTTKPAIGGAELATNGLAAPAGVAMPPKTSATSWVVADLDTGQVLGACAPHQAGAPASLEKLLLCAAVMPMLDPKQVVTITAADLDFEAGSSAVGLIHGGKYTVETLWLGLLLNSGNDAANVLARLGGGAQGIPGGVAAMNAEARHLGALDTLALTPSGLDGPGQVTSAYDLAVISRADFARADFRRYTASRTAQIPAEPPKDKHGYQIQNDNKLLFNYPGAIGGKTGFTDIARHTYMGAATRNGRTLVVTMLGGEHQPVRLWQQGSWLLDWGFSLPATASVGRLVAPGEVAAAPTPSPTTVVPLAAAATLPPRSSTTAVLITAAVVLALGGGAVLALRVRRRRRPRPTPTPRTTTPV